MSSLCYNIKVIFMEKKELFELIKIYEKKYTLMCTLYDIFKLNSFKRKRDFYNEIIIFLLNCSLKNDLL